MIHGAGHVTCNVRNYSFVLTAFKFPTLHLVSTFSNWVDSISPKLYGGMRPTGSAPLVASLEAGIFLINFGGTRMESYANKVSC